MMLYLKKKTSRKFYNKYPYKIALFTQLARSIDYSICKMEHKSKVLNYSNQDRATARKEVVRELAEKLFPFFKEDQCRRRVEGYHLNIFTSTKEDFDNIISITESYVSEVYEPSSEQELNFLESNSNKKILADKLPYGLYKYKIHIKYNITPDKKSKLNDFISKHMSNIKVSKQVYEWLRFNKRWCWAPYFYVKDSSALTMISLFLGTDIKKIEEYVLREEIATA